MNKATPTKDAARSKGRSWWLLLAALVLTTAIYWPGLSGSFLFDDYPNIVDNNGVHPSDASWPSLINAALSSPSSEFKRPLSSLSFAANYLTTGLNPFWMKLTNVVIHLVNGWLVFTLASALLSLGCAAAPGQRNRNDVIAALIAAGWLLLPINLTGVLYVVQRMESLANVFVLLGLVGYIAGRRRMLASSKPPPLDHNAGWTGFLLSSISITICTALGLLAKETAVMLPFYALLVEWAILKFRNTPVTISLIINGKSETRHTSKDWRLLVLFVLILALPLIAGLTWLLPGLLKPENWATRDFTLTTRLLSEARIVVGYVAWTLIPTPDALSFYHDDFLISTGLLAPWTTLTSIFFLIALVVLTFRLRSRFPLASLGIALFLACQLLTGTILPLELIYEHRNYFASFGLLMALMPLLAAAPHRPANKMAIGLPDRVNGALPFAVPRYVLLAGLMVCWTALTALTAQAWGNPLRLAQDLANRTPQSPRAQYELGRTYIIYSHYDPISPFTRLAYAPLERAASLPESSILPQQALIFMNSRMHLPIKDTWWDSMIAKLKMRKSTVQDESSLAALTQCAHEHQCDLPKTRMVAAYMAALSHPDPSARLLAMYGDYAWNVLDDHVLGERMTDDAVKAAPREPAYRITLVRMMAAQGRINDARAALRSLKTLDIGGSLDTSLNELQSLPGMQ